MVGTTIGYAVESVVLSALSIDKLSVGGSADRRDVGVVDWRAVIVVDRRSCCFRCGSAVSI